MSIGDWRSQAASPIFTLAGNANMEKTGADLGNPDPAECHGY